MLTEREIEARHRKRLEPWARRLVKLVSDKVGDARAHAENAVTVALRDTPDGRATAAKAKRSRSFAAANNRLDELLTTLAGPDDRSISGLIHDATETLYADSFALWFGQIDERFRVLNGSPPAKQYEYVRGLLWFGLPVRAGLANTFSAAKTALLAAVGSAGTSTAGRKDGAAILDGWEARTRAAILTRAGLALSDANQRADLQAMRDVILPRYRDDEP